MDLSLVVPIFHENENATSLLKEIEKRVKTKAEVLFIYDTVDDPTIEYIKKYKLKKKNIRVKLIKNFCGSGRGVMNAIQSGFLKSKGEAVVVVMGDLSDDTSQVDLMYETIQRGFDIVCGSRYMKGGKKIGGPAIKTFLSRIAGVSLNRIFKIPTHDATNAFKMYRREVLRRISIESTGGFEYSLEILIKAHKKGYKITEIPTTWRDRTLGKSRFELSWLPKYIKCYLLVFKPYSKAIANKRKAEATK